MTGSRRPTAHEDTVAHIDAESRDSFPAPVLDVGLREALGDPAGRAWLGELTEDPPLRLYLALLRTPSPTAATLGELELPPSVIQQAARVLEQHGMIEERPGGILHVEPPEVAVPAYLGALERRVRSTRDMAPRLSELYRQAHEGTRGTRAAQPDVRLLTGHAEVDAASSRLVAAATRSIDVMATPASWESALGLVAARGERLNRRAVLDERLLDDQEALARILALRESGVDVRITLRVPLTFHIVDERAVLLQVDDGPGSTGVAGFEVRHRQLVEGLVRIFWLTHEHANPVPVTRRTAHSRSRDREVRMLALLATGASDSVIARRLGISQRTVERHVRNLMDSLGATTRFQAGVQAARKGLL